MPDTPSNDRAAAVLERIIRNVPFVHGNPDHEQFLKDAKISIKEPQYENDKQEKNIGEILVVTVADPHITTAPKAAGDFVAAKMDTVPVLAPHIAKGHIRIEVRKDDTDAPDQLRVLLHLPDHLTAAQAIAGIAALDPVSGRPHSHAAAPNPLHFAQVDSAELVGLGVKPGVEKADAQKIAAEILAKHGSAQAAAPCATSIADALSPLAETLIASVETAHRAIEIAISQAERMQAPARLSRPSTLVSVAGLSAAPPAHALAR